MEQTNQNAQRVITMYEDFKRGDIPAILEHISDECVWVGAGEGFLPPGGVYHGKDVVRFFQLLDEHEEISTFNVLSVGAINENEVAAFGNITMAPKSTGKAIDLNWAMHWKFNKAGKAVYFHDFFDTAAAYEAHKQPELAATN